MISRATERQIAEFIDFLESHFARLKQEFDRRAKTLSKTDRTQLLKDTMVVAYREREKFDPLLGPMTEWFHECLTTAIYDNIVPDDDELELLKNLSPTPTTAGQHKTPSSQEGGGPATAAPGLDPSQKAGKECPPCWRCRYFDGWLPKKPPAKPTGNYSAMDQLCFEIDTRKVAIASYVRDEYPEFLED